MYIAEFYDTKKTYITKDGQLINKEKFEKLYPASLYTKMVVFLEGNALIESNTFEYLKAHYLIPDILSDEESLQTIQKLKNDELTESNPLERIAASLEYISMVYMGG